MQEKVKRIKLLPFHHTLVLVVSSDVSASFEARRKRLKLSMPTPTGYGFTLTDTRSFDIYVFLPRLCGVGATAHEMFHVICFMMQQADAAFEEESYAHWIQYLTQVAAEFVHAPDRTRAKTRSKRKSR